MHPDITRSIDLVSFACNLGTLIDTAIPVLIRLLSIGCKLRMPQCCSLRSFPNTELNLRSVNCPDFIFWGSLTFPV